MEVYYPVAITTLVTGVVYFWMAARVSLAHRKTGILAPTMIGDPVLERTIRAHANTLEWMPIFLPSLWLFAIYWDVTIATILGATWIVGRIIYFLGYIHSATMRRPGFFIQVIAAFALMLGALGRLIYLATISS